MKSFIRNFSRILTAVVFIFSGFVKGVDPMGTAYKFEDYFIALNLPWLMSFSIILAILLIAAEFILGWLLLFNIRTKNSSWFILAFMLLFTPLTLWLAITDKVTDCGCFGDFLVMTNMETFLKNLVLMVFVVVLFIYRKSFRNAVATWKQIAIAVVGIIIVFYSMHTGYNHEPYLDFRPFYVGSNLAQKMSPTPEKSELLLLYKDTVANKQYKYTTKELPYEDTAFFKRLEFIKTETKIIQKFKEAEAAFEIWGDAKQDCSNEILKSKEFLFVLFIQDVDKANKASFKKIAKLLKEAKKRGIEMIVVSGSGEDSVEKFLDEMGTPMKYYTADVIKIKTVVRANPGLVLLKNGYVLGKWHYNDFPDLKKLVIKGHFNAFAPAKFRVDSN